MSYIPARDADFDAWLINFSTLITATPTAYGLVAGDATIIAAEQTAFTAALLAATDPSTRTPSTVAAKDAARSSAEAVVRPYAMNINANSAVTDLQRSDLGLTIRKTTPTPIPAPTSAPVLEFRSATPLVHTLAFSDSAAPSGKAKPYGAIGLQLVRTVAAGAASDPTAALPVNTYGKSPLTVANDPGDVGQMATYWGRFVTRSGPAGASQAGPWSAALAVAII